MTSRHYKDGELVEVVIDGVRMTAAEYEAYLSCQAKPSGVTIIREIEPFISPATEQVVRNRREMREDMRVSGCVPYEPLNRKG